MNKYIFYFAVSVLVTWFDVLSNLVSLLPSLGEGAILLMMFLYFVSFFLGPALCVVFFILWIRELRKAKKGRDAPMQDSVLTNTNQVQEVQKVQIISTKPIIRKSLLYTMLAMISFFVVVGILVSGENTSNNESTSVQTNTPGQWAPVFLFLFVYGGVFLGAIMFVLAVVKTIEKRASK